uniref:hypothetical protein n=1 Tax=uncultured Dysgonomonas sp. TaxID=206096 RepID=UPI0025841CE2|nr:hypothetical protein [uncultured Dysgonomonas sp.]
MEKRDRLQILKERVVKEELSGDRSRVAEIVGVKPQSITRLFEKKSYAELTTINQRNIVNEFLKLLNARKEEEAKLDAELIGK